MLSCVIWKYWHSYHAYTQYNTCLYNIATYCTSGDGRNRSAPSRYTRSQIWPNARNPECGCVKPHGEMMRHVAFLLLITYVVPWLFFFFSFPVLQGLRNIVITPFRFNDHYISYLGKFNWFVTRLKYCGWYLEVALKGRRFTLVNPQFGNVH